MKHPFTTISPETADTGRIRVGAALRILPVATAAAPVADTGRIRTGAALRLPLGR